MMNLYYCNWNTVRSTLMKIYKKIRGFIRSIYYFFKNLPANIKLCIDTWCIKKFKNIHNGQACFVIGNGPSMTVADLDMMHKLGIKTFACNRIYKIFPETKWRPDYYFCSDDKLIFDVDFPKKEVPIKRRFFPRKYKSIVKKGNFYECLPFKWLKEGKFSKDAHKGVYQAGTIISEAIQFAYYMGFAKVYIVGVDFSYNMKSVDEKNQTFKDAGNSYFIKGYTNSNETLNIPSREANIFGFKAIREGFESEGREIYNATRGGMLEVFERKDLDQIFKELSEE